MVKFLKSLNFTSLNSGYGALHSYGKSPMPIYEAAEYVTVEQITPEEQAAGEELIPAEYIGTHKYLRTLMMILFLKSLALHL